MMHGKKWKKFLLAAAAAAVLVGNAAAPPALEAAGIRTGQQIYRTGQTVPEDDGSVTGTETGSVTDPAGGTQEVPAETPAAGIETPAETPAPKAVARVHMDGTDTEYMDIKEAWAAVNGRTAEITLLDHVTTTADMSTAFELTGGNVTLDLGGYRWTYQYVSEGETAPATFDLIELKGDATLTVKGSDGSGMVYAGSSSYKGACLYATGNTTLNIEGGTYSSNVSAPIYVDGATLNVKGGIFRAAGASESAITMNNGTFSMTGGEVQVGALTLNNTNGSQNVSIGGDCKISRIVTKGKEALAIGDTLDGESKYEDADDGSVPDVRPGEGQNGETINNVQTARSPVKVEITPSSSTDAVFSYDENEEICTLTANVDVTKDGQPVSNPSLTYAWSVTYKADADGREENRSLSGDTAQQAYIVKNGQDAGIYTYSVEVTYTDGADGTVYTETSEGMEVTVKALPDGEMTLKTDLDFPASYIYGQQIKIPEKKLTDYDLPAVSFGVAEDQLSWSRELLNESDEEVAAATGGAAFVENIDAGKYRWKITVGDEPNYKIVGYVPVEILPKEVYPAIGGTTQKIYDGTTDIKGARIVLANDPDGNGEGILDRDKGKVDITYDSFAYNDKNAGSRKIIAGNIRLEGDRAKNYELKAETCEANGVIEKAVLKLDIVVSPEKQNVDEPVRITLTARYKDGSVLGDHGPDANMFILNVSGRNDLEEKHSLALRADSGQNGVYTADYKTSIKGDKTFEASMVENDNYAVEGGKVSNSRLTIIREAVNTSLTLTASKSEITHGETVTYTATVTRTGSSTDNTLSGGVQFYIDGEGVSNQVGGAQRITSSGDTVSITMDESVLTVGEHTVTAKFTSDSAEPSQAEITTKVAEKPVEVIKSVVTLKAGEETVTYGDEVTYTATVTRDGGRDGDALSGGVQFYMDGEESSNRVGTAQSVRVSGDTVSIKLGRSDLSAGDHRIVAVFTPDAAEGSKAEVTTKVEKKKLTWDVSGLKASKTAGTAGEVKVYGTLEVDGILDGEIKFEQPESMITSGFKSADAGTYKVTVTVEDGEWTFDPKEPKNYELPEGDPEIKATVNALKELSDPPEAKDGNTYKLVMEEGLSTVPDGLKRTSFNTPGKIESELKRILTSSGVYTEANTAVYDVMLQVSTDEGKTWAAANAGNFPQEGVVVTLPYPGGTGRHTHNFAVAHMFGESLFGHTSGTVEVPAVTKTDNGIQFRVTGLSPIAVSWTEGAGGSVAGTSTSPVGTAVRRLLGAQTGDESPILLYAGLGAGCVILLLILGIVVFRRKKKNVR